MKDKDPGYGKDMHVTILLIIKPYKSPKTLIISPREQNATSTQC